MLPTYWKTSLRQILTYNIKKYLLPPPLALDQIIQVSLLDLFSEQKKTLFSAFPFLSPLARLEQYFSGVDSRDLFPNPATPIPRGSQEK